MAMPAPAPAAEPYRSAAASWWDAGWRGVIPVRGKFPPVRGWTGWDAPDPSWPDVCEWTAGETGTWNLALRLPPDVLGIDVDAYDGKTGAATLEEHQRAWGKLPATWVITSRDDGVSGIRLYRIPSGLAWPGQVGPGIETIHRGHRYVMAPPSLHPSGRIYRAIRPDGLVSLRDRPAPDGLPELPEAWVAGLSRGPASPDRKLDLTLDEATGWTSGTNSPRVARLCPELRAEVEEVLRALPLAGSRHELMRNRLLVIARLADQGHPGLHSALEILGSAFVASVGEDRADAAGEFGRMVAGAAGICAAGPDFRAWRDPCIPLEVPEPELPRPTLAQLTAEAEALLTGDLSAPVFSAPVPVVAPPEPAAWQPVPIDLLLAMDDSQSQPTELARLDGAKMLYPGAINGLLGPSESGKTWIALEAMRQAILAGRRVVMFDFEDTAAGIIGRLRALGLSNDLLSEYLRYATPDIPLDAENLVAMNAVLHSFRPALVVLDGVNAAMTVMGQDLVSNRDATAFYQKVLRPMATNNAAVLYIDHTPKNVENQSKGAIGAQAKRAMTTGVALRVDVEEPFSRSHPGRLTITVDKDRPGRVRAVSGAAQVVGTAHLVPSENGDQMTVFIALEEQDSSPELNRAVNLRNRIAAYLQAAGKASLNQIEENVKGPGAGKGSIRAAVDQLTVDGLVLQESGPRKSILCSLTAPLSTSPTSPRTGPLREKPGEVGAFHQIPLPVDLPSAPPPEPPQRGGVGVRAGAWATARPGASTEDELECQEGDSDA